MAPVEVEEMGVALSFLGEEEGELLLEGVLRLSMAVVALKKEKRSLKPVEFMI